MNPVGITLERVSKQFEHRVKGKVYAVRDLSLEVQPGELLTLLGPSGCGKTTTLRMIAGFQQPDAGRILIAGQDVTSLMANARNIGFVFQNYALFPHLSVHENVAYGLRVQKQSTAEIARAVGEVLALVGLEGHDRQMPNQLSGGEQQRVALARAIVIKPRVLLFDEPLSNLDARLRVQMRGEIQRLQKTLGITAVYVTHDQEEAMAISDRIAVMNAGVIAQQGTAETLYRSPATEFVAQFIGRTNLLTARVVSVSPSKVDLEVQGRPLWTSHAPPGLKAGQTVRLMVRPEAIELRPVITAGALHGKVVSRTFLGEKVEYQLRMGTELVQVTDYNPSHTGALQPGETVTLDIAPDAVRVLPGGRP